MNPSYGDPSNDGYSDSGGRPSSGRARVPGTASDYDDGYGGQSYGSAADRGYDSGGRDGYDGGYDSAGYREDSYEPRRAPSGSAAVPGATAGRASVSGSARVPSQAPVRSGSGYDDDYDYGYPDAGERTSSVTGRASVGSAPVSPVAGRASVGRARVGTPDDFDVDLDAPGGPDGPRRGRGPGGGGRGPGGPGRDDADGQVPPPKKKRRKRTWILSSVAVLIMLAGLVVVIGAYQFNGIPDPKAYTPPQSTTVYYSDGVTPMAKFGDENRTLVTLDQVSQWVPWAVVATEDMSFYSNSGVSFRGIARAAWNNVKGGDTQGGSTISQQYMKQTLTNDPSQRTYKVKIQEALGAIKLDEKFKKDQIMQMYLNVIWFGRGAYGIEAASQAYFNKPSKDLTLEESMVLADVIKSPGGAFDPAVNLEAAKGRWNYTKKNLLALKKITPAQYQSMQYPTTFTKPDPNKDLAEFGKDLPSGLIVHHVLDELYHMTDAKGNPRFPALSEGGYQITTTINKTLQDAAYNYASVNGANSEVKKQAMNPAQIQAGVVSVDPNTGDVLAYYGGDRGDGFDFAGIYRDPILDKNPDGTPDDSWQGGSHPPGSSMKIYTLAAAIKAGISINSYWFGPPSRDFPKEGRTKATGNPVRNAESSTQWANGVTLVGALQNSLNTVYYAVGERVGAAAVVDMAHAMGINHIWDQQNPVQRHDLSTLTGDVGQQVAAHGISTEVSIGQFPITVLDHANGVATIAAGGVYRPAHFVKSATGPNGFKYTAPAQAYSLADEGILTQQQAADLRYAMEQVLVPGAGNGYSGLRPNGWDAGGKSGTWEVSANSSHNGDAWFVGFTPKLATAVWVGNVKDNLPIMIKNGSKSGKDIAGANLPGSIFKDVMTAGLKVVGQTKNQAIPVPGSFTGDTTVGDVPTPSPSSPSPSPGATDMPCQLPAICPTTPAPGGGGGGGPGGGGGHSTSPSPSASKSKGPGH